MSALTAAPNNSGDTTALVVEGGAMRGIFAAGVLDSFLDKEFMPFSMCIGVSAGANNLAGFLAGKWGRNYRVLTDYSPRPEFISVRRFLSGGHLMDIDWLWDVTIRDLPLDTGKIARSSAKYFVGLTRVADGKAVLVQPTEENLGEVLKASSAMPLAYRNFVGLAGVEPNGGGQTGNGTTAYYVDGGVADPIPVQEAYRRGARRILVIRSRPYSFRMSRRALDRPAQVFLRDYPELQSSVARRPERYNRSIHFIRNPPKGMQILELNPPDSFESSSTTRDRDALKRDYRRGLVAGQRAVMQWSRLSD